MPAPAAPEIAHVQASLRANAPFIAMLGGPEQAVLLDEALAGLGAGAPATMRVCNPLTTPLSLERIMLQLAPVDGEPEPGDDAGPGVASGDDSPNASTRRVLRAMMARLSGQPALLVIVEQAHTLTAPALAFLQLLPELRHPGLPSVHVAFVGSSAFRALLADPRFRTIAGHLERPLPDAPADPASSLASVAPAAIAPASVAAASIASEPGMPAGTHTGAPTETPLALGRRLPRPAILGAGIAAAALAGVLLLNTGPRSSSAPAPIPATTAALAPAATPRTTAALPAQQPAQPPAAPAPEVQPPITRPAPAPAPPPLAAPPASAFADPPPGPVPETIPASEPPTPVQAPAPEEAAAARARLFREFDAFVRARGLSGRLSRANREALFQEYLVRRQAPPAAPLEAEVTLLFQAGSVGSETLANQNAALLRPQVRGLVMRDAAGGPPVPTVRYFYAADRDTALRLAGATPLPGREWQVVDLTAAADKPAPTTIEMWLPAPRGRPARPRR